MIDTCQANSMFSKFYSPNILATGSSQVGENSYSVSPSLHHQVLLIVQYANDNDIGVAVIDSFTHYILEYMEGINKTSQMSMQDLVSFLFVVFRCLTDSITPIVQYLWPSKNQFTPWCS